MHLDQIHQSLISPANSGRTGQKDTLINIRNTNEFSISMVNYNMVEQVSLSSCEYNSDTDEFVKSGFSKRNHHYLLLQLINQIL